MKVGKVDKKHGSKSQMEEGGHNGIGAHDDDPNQLGHENQVLNRNYDLLDLS